MHCNNFSNNNLYIKKVFSRQKVRKVFNIFAIYYFNNLFVLFELAFDMIFNLKKFAITENAIFLGVITASISSVLVKLLGKIKKGELDEKQVLTAILVAIDSLPLGDKKFSIASRILKLIITSDLNQVEDSIVNCLSENSCESQSKIKKVAEKILQSVKKDTI